MLIGRAPECARIASLLADARRGISGALVLAGEPGIGKSSLCGWAVTQAAGMRVRSVHSVESEVGLPFAGLSELCASDVDRIALLPAPQARALEGALARTARPAGDRFAIGAAVLSLLALVGDGEPVLLLLDDVQWLDGSSADALLFAARRLRNEAVVILVATRPGTVFDDDRNGLPRLTLGGLEPRAARALLERSHASLHATVVERLVADTGGNPLALLEVPRVLTEAQRAGDAPIAEPMPLGPTLERALLRRASDLSDDARRAVMMAAASGGDRMQPVLEALAASGLDPAVLDEAERAGVLTLIGDCFEFRHPLLRSAIYHGATSAERRATHAAFAAVTVGDERAWHLARATVGEDEAVAATLERLGLHARRRGAPAAAAAALEHAARLSESSASRARRLIEAARDAHLAGRPASARRLLDAALANEQDSLQRAEIQRLRGRVLVMQGQSELAYQLLVEEAALMRDADAACTARMLAEACLHCLLGLNIRSAVAAARDACGAATRADPAVQAYAAAMLACALILKGERSEAANLLDGHLPLLRSMDPLSEAGELIAVSAQCYFWLDRYDVASELLAGLIGAARRASAPAALLLPLSCRAELDLRAGRWSVAEAQFDEVARLGEEMAHPVFAAYALECLARLAAAAGDERRCRDHAAHAMTFIDEHHNEVGRLYVHSALGLLELALGRVEEAIGALDDARALAARHGVGEPNIVHWQSDLIEAYVRAGDKQAAVDALDALDRQAHSTGGRWALGTAARCRGLLTDGPVQDECFAAALDHLRNVPAAFEIARTYLCQGECLRRAGRRTDARRALKAAIDEFERLGAHVWTARAHSELLATGMHVRRPRQRFDPDQLTAHELQVALVVASGATNREAAAALFLSPKTIEFHLAHIYRKLGVRTRTELAGVAARRGWFDEARDFPGASAARAWQPH